VQTPCLDQWKLENKKLDFTQVEEDLSDEYVNIHPAEFRKRILSGDLAAIKKGFSQKHNNKMVKRMSRIILTKILKLHL